MNAFELLRADSGQHALAAAQQGATTRFLAGGTGLLDLMKLGVEQPAQVIDISRLPFNEVEAGADGGLKIGALVRNADLARHALVRQNYPLLGAALLAGASAQLRNMATTGGNLLQRTRCVYFRDTAAACNKRQPGSGCPAIVGFNRSMAILGASDACIATNASDMNVALMALEANIHVQSSQGSRSVPIGQFYLLPGATPERETVLEPGELITHVSLAAPAPGSRSTYLKLRDRASYEFALVSAAVIATVADGRFVRVRIALGGVGSIPWRAPEAEQLLENAPVNADSFMRAAQAALRDARAQSGNAFKIELARRCLVQALRSASGLAEEIR